MQLSRHLVRYALLSLLLAACANEATAPATPVLALSSTAGVYSIRFIDGRNLPVVVCSGDKVTSGSLRLRSDKTFLASVTFKSLSAPTSQTFQERGTYSRPSGTSRLDFLSTSRPGTTWKGSILSDGSIRVTYPVSGRPTTPSSSGAHKLVTLPGSLAGSCGPAYFTALHWITTRTSFKGPQAA